MNYRSHQLLIRVRLQEGSTYPNVSSQAEHKAVAVLRGLKGNAVQLLGVETLSY